MGKRLAAIFIGLVVAFLASEFFFKTAIIYKVKFFRKPALYANSFTDEEFWKLHLFWKPWKWNPVNFNSLLGWSQAAATQQNPLGLQPDTLERLKQDDRKKILFYGDSFIKGVSSPEFFIPQYLNSKIPGADVLDLGVGGFGSDQIYLMFLKTHEEVKRPLVLIGLLVEDDMDRAILKFRSAPKPYFVFDSGGNLSLRGVPVQPVPQNFFKKATLLNYNFTYLFLKNKFYKNDRSEEKMRLNSKFIELIQDSCQKQNAKLVYVLFYGKDGVKGLRHGKNDWREPFVKSELKKRGIGFIDTKPALLAYAAANTIDIAAFYAHKDGHHNDLGNRVIGDEILRWLKEKGLL